MLSHLSPGECKTTQLKCHLGHTIITIITIIIIIIIIITTTTAAFVIM